MHFASDGAGKAGNWKDSRHRSLRRICLRRIGSRSQNEVTWQRNFHDAFGETGRMCSKAELPTWSLHWARRFLLYHLDLMLAVAKLMKKQDVCSACRKGLCSSLHLSRGCCAGAALVELGRKEEQTKPWAVAAAWGQFCHGPVSHYLIVSRVSWGFLLKFWGTIKAVFKAVACT